jgi:hypothetical protein
VDYSPSVVLVSIDLNDLGILVAKAFRTSKFEISFGLQFLCDIENVPALIMRISIQAVAVAVAVAVA